MMGIKEIPKFEGDFRIGTLYFAEAPAKSEKNKTNHFLLKVLEPDYGSIKQALMHLDYRITGEKLDLMHKVIFKHCIIPTQEEKFPGMKPIISEMFDIGLIKRHGIGDGERFVINTSGLNIQNAKVMYEKFIEFWSYNPVTVTYNNKKKDGKHGLFLMGEMHFEVHKLIDGIKNTKVAISRMVITTEAKEFDYMKPMDIKWFLENEQWLKKNNFISGVEAIPINEEKYLTKRQALMGY